MNKSKNYTNDDIIKFVRSETSSKERIEPQTTLQNDLGLYGDDLHELIQKYAKQFGVNVSKYLWYFHTGEEGINLGALFFKPPYTRVTEIPITIAMLQNFANTRSWSLQYPSHTLPKHRIDLFINRFILCLFLAVVILLGIMKLVGK